MINFCPKVSIKRESGLMCDFLRGAVGVSDDVNSPLGICNKMPLEIVDGHGDGI